MEFNFEYNRNPKRDKQSTILTIIISMLLLLTIILLFINTYLALAPFCLAVGGYIGAITQRDNNSGL